jgi:serine/threonine protein kinase
MEPPETIRLFNQGGHGCLFYPGPSCQGGMEDKKYLTKIHLDDEKQQNEIAISNKIKKIKSFASYFSPIISHCKLDLAEISETEINKCDFIRENPYKRKNFMTTKTFYIKGKDYSDYLKEKNHSSQFVMEIYNKLILIINKLAAQGISHFDLKTSNLIIKLDTLQPIVIDFGISIIIDEVKTEKQYKDAFYIYSTDYLPWSIDIVVMSYLVQKYSTFESLVTEIDIQEIKKIINIKMDEVAAILDMPLTSNGAPTSNGALFSNGALSSNGPISNGPISNGPISNGPISNAPNNNGPISNAPNNNSSNGAIGSNTLSAENYRYAKYQHFKLFMGKKVRQVVEELKSHYKEWDIYSIAIMTASIAQNYGIKLNPKIREKIIRQIFV